MSTREDREWDVMMDKIDEMCPPCRNEDCSHCQIEHCLCSCRGDYSEVEDYDYQRDQLEKGWKYDA